MELDRGYAQLFRARLGDDVDGQARVIALAGEVADKLLPILAIASFEREQDGHRLLPVLNIFGRFLSSLFDGCPDTAHVIPYLKCQSQLPPKPPESSRDVGARAADDGSGPGTVSRQGGRLETDHADVLAGRHVLPGFETHVQVLTIGKRADGELKAASKIEGYRRERMALQNRCTGRREHCVPGIDGLSLSPHLPYGGTVAPRGVAVLDVVVDQREVVKKLDRRGGSHSGGSVAAQSLAGEEAEPWTEPLAAWRPLRSEPFVDVAELVLHHAVQSLDALLPHQPQSDFPVELLPPALLQGGENRRFYDFPHAWLPECGDRVGRCGRRRVVASAGVIVVGTRGSGLALRQTHIVTAALQERFPDIEVVTRTVETTGDRVQNAPISSFGDKGVFVRAIELALLEGSIDLAVHSLKDVPSDEETPQLEIVAYSTRADPRDALLGRGGARLADLPSGARVGTSSLRRRVQLARLRGDLTIEDVRGNVDTRLRKLQSGAFDAVVLAMAGLTRLGLDGHITQTFSVDEVVPDAGQGIIAVQCRAGDSRALLLGRAIDDPSSRVAAEAERAVVRALGAGCRSPVGAYAAIAGDTVTVRGMAASADGSLFIRDTVTGSTAAAGNLGRELGERLRHHILACG